MTDEQIWDAVELSESFGCVIRRDAVNGRYKDVEHIPFAMEPSKIYQTTFESLQATQIVLNKLIHDASADVSFMNDCLHHTAEADDFWGNLLRIYNMVMKNPNPITLGLHRTDYLLEKDMNSETPRMVEFNTIASSMGGHAENIAEVHRILGHSKVLKNEVTPNLGRFLADAVLAYSSLHKSDLKDLIVLTLRESPGSANFSDQRKVEIALAQRLGCLVSVRRVTYQDLMIDNNSKLDETGRFYYQGVEVAAFYLRDGYDPESFTSAELWKARELVDTSLAVKCPPVQYHLMTNKVFQAKFSNKAVLRRFLTDEEVETVSQVMIPMTYLTQWSDPLVTAAKACPSSFCLKILREGGHTGNVFEDLEVAEYLSKMESDRALRTEYCLMKMINSTKSLNTLVRAGQSSGESLTISEYGIYGGYLVVNGKAELNETCGHLVRVKPEKSYLGGVSIGAAAIGSVIFNEAV